MKGWSNKFEQIGSHAKKIPTINSKVPQIRCQTFPNNIILKPSDDKRLEK
jgi:hypothetical protein